MDSMTSSWKRYAPSPDENAASEQEKALADLLTFGTGVLHIGAEGEVAHVPLQSFSAPMSEKAQLEICVAALQSICDSECGPEGAGWVFGEARDALRAIGRLKP